MSVHIRLLGDSSVPTGCWTLSDRRRCIITPEQQSKPFRPETDSTRQLSVKAAAKGCGLQTHLFQSVMRSDSGQTAPLLLSSAVFTCLISRGQLPGRPSAGRADTRQQALSSSARCCIIYKDHCIHSGAISMSITLEWRLLMLCN